MAFALNQLGQVALPISDVDRAEAFCEKTLGLHRLYRFGDLTFFDCADGHTLALMQEAPNGYAPPG